MKYLCVLKYTIITDYYSMPWQNLDYKGIVGTGNNSRLQPLHLSMKFVPELAEGTYFSLKFNLNMARMKPCNI